MIAIASLSSLVIFSALIMPISAPTPVPISAPTPAPISASITAPPAWPSHLPPEPKITLKAQGAHAMLDIDLGQKWKTYGRQASPTSIAPRFDWSQSKNLKKARVDFPKPRLFTLFGGKMIGYQGRLILPIHLVRRDDSAPLDLNLLFSYAICDEICVPLQQRLRLTLAPKSRL